MTSENWSPRDLMESIRDGDLKAIAEAGMMNYKDADYIADYYEKYEMYHGINPVKDKDDKYDRLVRRASTREFNKAIGEGHIARIAYAVGHRDDNNKYWNITHFLESYWAKKIDGSAVGKVLVNGDEGAGKTDYMLEEGFNIAPRVIKRETDKKVIGIGNVDVDVESTNLDEFRFSNRTSRLDALLKNNYAKDVEIIVCIDEGDQLFGGVGKSQKRAREIGDRVKLFRKYNAHIFMTSQRQVAPDIRNRFDVRHKPDDDNPERMVIADTTTPEGKPDDIKVQTNNVPETSITYRTDARGMWNHDVDDEDNLAPSEARGGDRLSSGDGVGKTEDEDTDENSEAVGKTDTNAEDRDSGDSNLTYNSEEIQLPDEIEGKREEIKYMNQVLGMTQEEIAEVYDDKQPNIAYYLR